MRDIKISSGLTYVIAVLSVVVPPALLILYLKNHNKWTDEQAFQKKYGAMLAGAKVDWKENKKSILLMPSFFYLRRMVFAATCIFLHDFFWMQIAVSMFLTTTAMIALLWTLPHEERSQTKIESMNEASTLIVLILVMMFSDFVPNPWTRYRVGHAFNAVILIHIAILLLINLVNIVKNLISWIRQKFAKCKSKAITNSNSTEVQNQDPPQ